MGVISMTSRIEAWPCTAETEPIRPSKFRRTDGGRTGGAAFARSFEQINRRRTLHQRSQRRLVALKNTNTLVADLP